MITTDSPDPGQDNVGQRVVVLPLQAAADFSPAARAHARAGAVGLITGYSNSHGLAYEVAHVDGTVAWYNPEELTKSSGLTAREIRALDRIRIIAKSALDDREPRRAYVRGDTRLRQVLRDIFHLANDTLGGT